MNTILPSDPRIKNLQALYGELPVWGWADVQDLYNLLIGKGVSNKFDSSITLSGLSDPSDFQVDLYVANNPVNYGTSGPLWSQNLVTGRVATTSTDTIDIPVTKVWQDGGHAENRPDSITVVLYQDGEETTKTLELNSSNNWSGTFSDLDSSHTYTIEENSVDGYASTISGSQNGGFTITNKSTDTVDAKVTKNWVGPKGDSITVYLYKVDGNGTKTLVGQKDITRAMGWTYTFSDLSKYDSDGNLIKYTLDEKTNNYNVKIESDNNGGYVITNSPKTTPETPSIRTTVSADGQSETISIPVRKEWADESKKTAVTFELLRDGYDRNGYVQEYFPFADRRRGDHEPVCQQEMGRGSEGRSCDGTAAPERN